MRLLAIAGALILSCAVTACTSGAVTGKNHPKPHLPSELTERTTGGFALGRYQLHLVKWLLPHLSADKAHPGAADWAMVRGVEALEVRQFQLDPGRGPAIISQLADDMTQSGWQRAIRINDGQQQVAVMTQILDERIEGIVVLVAEPEEVMYVKLIGSIEPQYIQPLVSQWAEAGESIDSSLQ